MLSERAKTVLAKYPEVVPEGYVALSNRGAGGQYDYCAACARALSEDSWHWRDGEVTFDLRSVVPDDGYWLYRSVSVCGECSNAEVPASVLSVRKLLLQGPITVLELAQAQATAERRLRHIRTLEAALGRRRDEKKELEKRIKAPEAKEGDRYIRKECGCVVALVERGTGLWHARVVTNCSSVSLNAEWEIPDDTFKQRYVLEA